MNKRVILTVGVGALVAFVVILSILGWISHDMSGYRISVSDEGPAKLSYAPVFRQVSAGNWSAYASSGTLYVSYIYEGDAYKFLVTCDYKCSASATRMGNFFTEARPDAPLSAVFDFVANEKYHAYMKYVDGMYHVAFATNE